jgi:hypothetical protein
VTKHFEYSFNTVALLNIAHLSERGIASYLSRDYNKIGRGTLKSFSAIQITCTVSAVRCHLLSGNSLNRPALRHEHPNNWFFNSAPQLETIRCILLSEPSLESRGPTRFCPVCIRPFFTEPVLKMSQGTQFLPRRICLVNIWCLPSTPHHARNMFSCKVALKCRAL